MAVTAQSWLDAQNSVLGSLLIAPELVPKVITETEPADFNGACRTVYDAIRKLFNAGIPVDPVSLRDVLGKAYQPFLLELMEITPTAANIDSYIRICREQSRVLAVQTLAVQMAEAETTEELRTLLEKASGMMIDRPSVQTTNMEQALRSFMERHARKPEYLTWPIREFDNELYAEPGDFIIFGGRPSTGKSAFALQCAWHWAQRYKVGFFSLETSAEKLFDRQMASVARIAMGDIKRNTISDSGWRNVAGMNQEIISTRLDLIRAAGMTVADIRAKTVMEGYKLIIIDYLQLIQASGENRTAQVTNISIALHTLAQSLGVTVVALSQLARPGQQGSDRGMASLRESGQIEQDADVVMILKLEDESKPSGDRILSIEKNKEGTCPAIKLAFDGTYQTFSKSKGTGDMLQKYMAEGKKARRQNRQESQQMSILPDDTPVPFDEKG